MNIIEGILRFIVTKIFRVRLSEQKWGSLLQFVKFGIVGVSNTLIGFIIYIVSLYAMRCIGLFEGYDYYVAQFIMFVLSVLWSFYWNNKAVFVEEEGEERNILFALLKTYASYALTSLLLNELLLILWVDIIGLNEYFAPLLNLLITVPLNFLIQKYWAFNKKG